jgi:tetratricopeptide (TPR) repeat protein
VLADHWAPPKSWIRIRPQLFNSLMLLHQDQPLQAEPALVEIVRYQDEHWTDYLPDHKNLLIPLDRTGPARQALGEAYAREGRFKEAVETLERAVTVSERISGAAHPQVLSARLSLAEALTADQRADEARHLLSSLQTSELNALPADHPILAQWYRVNGLLGVGDAQKDLTHALNVYQSAYGPTDWRVVRARRDLQLASGTRPKS